MDYNEFLKAKIKIAPKNGFDLDLNKVSPFIKPHNKIMVKWLVEGGRRACFASFGLHKTVTQLEAVRCILEIIGSGSILFTPKLNGWLTYYNGTNQASRILTEPVGTLPTHDRVAMVIHPDKDKLTLDDLLYRTIRAHEVKRGMAFDDDYIILGNSGEQVKQLGNAVTPPVMEWLLERGIETFM